METLANVCRGLDITPVEVKEALAPEDIKDWRKDAVSNDTLNAFSRSLVQRREMDQGKRPTHYTEQATCKRCDHPHLGHCAKGEPEAIAGKKSGGEHGRHG